MKKMPLLLLAPACALGALLFSGCASITINEIKEERASTRPVSEEKEGLVVSCQILTNPKDVEFFFGQYLIDWNILPVVVYLENKGQDTFTLEPKNAQVVFENGSALGHVPWRTVADRISFSYWRAVPWYFFVLIPGFVVASSVTTANEHIDSRYHGLAMEELALPPTAVKQGVIFFTPPEDEELDIEDVAKGVDVRLPFQRRAGQRTLPCDVWFRVKGKQ